MRNLCVILLLCLLVWNAPAAVNITPFGLTNRFIQITNGVSRDLTNLGAMYSDRLVVTNLIVGTNANTVQITNGTVITSGNIESSGTVYAPYFFAYGSVATPYIFSPYPGGNKGGFIDLQQNEFGVIVLRDIPGTNFSRLVFGANGIVLSSNFPALKRNGASLEITDGVGNSRATNNLIVPGVVISTNGFILPASTPFTAPASLGWQGSHLWSDGTNLCVVLQNSAGTRTTNKVTLTAWP